MTMATQPANLAGLLAAPDVTGKPSPDAAGFPARPAGPSEAVSGSDRRRRPGLRSSTRGDVYRDPTTSVVGLALALPCAVPGAHLCQGSVPVCLWCAVRWAFGSRRT